MGLSRCRHWCGLSNRLWLSNGLLSWGLSSGLWLRGELRLCLGGLGNGLRLSERKDIHSQMSLTLETMTTKKSPSLME